VKGRDVGLVSTEGSSSADSLDFAPSNC